MPDTFVDNTFNTENTIDNILSIRVQPDGFSFSVVNPHHNNLLAFNHTKLKISSQHFIPRRFTEWFDSEKILQNKYSEIHVFVDTPKFTFVPEHFFDENKKELIINSLFQIDDNIETESNKIESHNTNLIYVLPVGLRKHISDKFEDFSLIHPVKLMLEQLPEITGTYGLTLVFNTHFFYAILFRNNEFILANSFPFSNLNDILFYALSLVKQMKINPAKTNLFFCGRIPDREMSMIELKKYFLSVEALKPGKEIKINFENHNITVEDHFPLFYEFQ